MKKDPKRELSKELAKPIPKKVQKNIEMQFLEIAEHKDSKIYLSQTNTNNYWLSLEYLQMVNAFFRKLFIPDKDKLDIHQRLHLICWAADGLVVSDYQNHISEDTAKEVSLALHLGLPVWILRSFKLLPVYAVVKSMQGGKYNANKFGKIVTEEDMESKPFSVNSEVGQETILKSKMWD